MTQTQPLKDQLLPKRFLSASSITIALIATLFVNAVFAFELTAFSTATNATPPAPWQAQGLPGRSSKPLTQFDVTELDNKKVLRVRTDKSYGNLVHAWQGNVSTISFNWRLDTPLLDANLRFKNTDDTALKVCVSFDMPIEKVPYADRAKLKVAQFLSHDHLPTATICYVWAHIEPVGADFDNPFTGRVHYIVLNSGETPLKTWQSHQRNISADFLKAYGDESKTVPTVIAISVGADSDNTQASSLGYVSDITLKP
ncbi:MAG: hypothetical protein RL761_719 [Pseudomonadota bacterium]|jgi:hypothetical protein